MTSVLKILESLDIEDGLEVSKLQKALKLTKKIDRDNLNIAIKALTKLGIVQNINEDKLTINKDIATAWLALPILITKEAPFTRKQFQIYLEERNIQTRVVFTGNILRQPMCKGIEKKVTSAGLKNADEVMERGVLLPLHHGMTNEMFRRLHSCIESFINAI